ESVLSGGRDYRWLDGQAGGNVRGGGYGLGGRSDGPSSSASCQQVRPPGSLETVSGDHFPARYATLVASYGIWRRAKAVERVAALGIRDELATQVEILLVRILLLVQPYSPVSLCELTKLPSSVISYRLSTPARCQSRHWPGAFRSWRR